jgi:hypothetical protein
MSRYSAAFLDLTTPGGIVRRRWQSRWRFEPVTWEGESWAYREFSWAGISSGAVIGASPARLSFPCLGGILSDLQAAHDDGLTGRLRVYHYPDTWTDPGPPASQLPIASISGVVSIESITMEPPVVAITLGGEFGGMFPPRVADTALIGTPCELGEG